MPKLHPSCYAALFLPIFPRVGKLPRHIGVLLPFITCFGQDFSKCLVIRATDAGRGQKCRRYFGCKAPIGSHAEQSPAVVPILRLLSETEFWPVLISSHPLPFKMYLRVNLRSVRHRCRLMLLLMIIHRLASSCAQLLCFCCFFCAHSSCLRSQTRYERNSSPSSPPLRNKPFRLWQGGMITGRQWKEEVFPTRVLLYDGLV